MKKFVVQVFFYIFDFLRGDFKSPLNVRSHHTSGIESPSELSDSPCQTVPSSPQKAKGLNAICADSNLSNDQQMKLTAVEKSTPHRGSIEVRRDTVSKELPDSADGKRNQNAETRIPEEASETFTKEETPSLDKKDDLDENEMDVLAAELADARFLSSPKSVEKVRKSHLLDDDTSKAQFEEQSISEPSADFVTCASELGSCSSIEGETFEDISPIERVMLERCIRAGLPQRNAEQTQGVRQKIPQVSYQLLRDTVEKHPKACSFESDRNASLKSLELKENEYESHSENEEKGKEDERKAEKKRLFRIPESPIDKKSTISNKSDCSALDNKESKQTESSDVNVLVDQTGNRRCEKVKPKQNSSEMVPTHLDFLMTSKKIDSTVTSKSHSAKASQGSSESLKKQKNGDLDLIDTEVDFGVKNIKEISNQENAEQTSFMESQTTEFSERNDVEYNENQTFEKDVDCNEKENNGDSEECMLSSSLLCEAREIAEALLGARMDSSTEDMTVSTLSCLSDIDNARPPSVMAEMGSLSMANSTISEENLKTAVTKECQKLLGKGCNKQMPSSKKSLLRELQIGRLNSEHGSNDFSKGSNDSPENLSMKSSSASDLLGNINPPSILDEMSLTASTGSLNGLEGSDSECDSEKIIAPYPSKQESSMSERMHDAAAMAQLYAKELSNITGNCIKESASNDALSRMKTQSGVQEVMEVTVADVTEIGCDTIGSDTELEEDLPCDDEDPGSDTLQAPFQKTLSREDQGDGSIENLTITLTEEPHKDRTDMSPYFDFSKNSGCFMTADEFKALQENADMILNTLREAEISDDEDDEDHCGMSSGDMLDDETMSLVSNESDEEFLSPDGSNSHPPKHSPKTDHVYNGMIALPQSSANAPLRYSKKTSLPQMSAKSKQPSSGVPKPQFSESPKKVSGTLKTNQVSENSLSRIKPPISSKKPLGSVCGVNENNGTPENGRTPEEEYSGGFDSRTFTRKKSTVPKGMIPSIQGGNHAPRVGSLRSPSSHNIPSLPGSSENVAYIKGFDSSKPVSSKLAAVSKTGKVRSKSMGDPNRNSKFKLEKSASTGSDKDEKFGANQSERSSSETPSPQSPLSRSSTCEKLNDEDGNSSLLLKRPSSLPLSHKTGSPRHVKIPSGQQRPVYTSTQRQASEGIVRPTRTTTKTDAVSPTSYQNSSNIPKFQNKAQPSLIPNRRSMIPTPAKIEFQDN